MTHVFLVDRHNEKICDTKSKVESEDSIHTYTQLFTKRKSIRYRRNGAKFDLLSERRNPFLAAQKSRLYKPL